MKYLQIAVIPINVTAFVYFLYKAVDHFGGFAGVFKGLGKTIDLATTDQYGGYGFLLTFVIGIPLLIVLRFILSEYKRSKVAPKSISVIQLFVRLIIFPLLIVIIANFFLT